MKAIFTMWRLAFAARQGTSGPAHARTGPSRKAEVPQRTKRAKRSFGLLKWKFPAFVSAEHIEVVFFGGLIPTAVLWVVSGQFLKFVLPLFTLFPLLLGLRYGFLAGTGGAMLTSGAMALLSYLKPDLFAEFPRSQVIALLLAGMIAGEVRGVCNARISRLESLCQYHRTRLEQFTGTYHSLLASHAQLEHRMSGHAIPLRTSLERLKLHAADHGTTLAGSGSALLDILVEAGGLYTAALYEIGGDGHLRLPSVASIGGGAELSPSAPLLLEALRTGSYAGVHPGSEASAQPVIAVVPLTDATGHTHGVLSISDMPFLSIHQDTFNMLGALARHMGDILSQRPRLLGEADHSFREQFDRWLLHATEHGVSSALLVCQIVDAANQAWLTHHCCDSGRGLDRSWITSNPQGRPLILKILPLADKAGVQCYLARLKGTGAGEAGVTSGIATRYWMLDDNTRTGEKILNDVAAVFDIDALNATPVDEARHAHLEATL
jgi:polysaccharide biosynthesis protein PelD